MLKTALIVDDSKLARLTLKRLLEKYDLEVSEAEGVVDAERWISTNVLPDLVFMDVMMPEIDGFEGLARLRKEPDTKNIPVIMYSGDVTEEARKRARDSGATGYLPKPADAGRLDHLLKALNERLGSTSRTSQQNVAQPSQPQPQPTSTASESSVSVAATVQPVPPVDVQPAVASELKRRMDELEHRFTIQEMNAGNPDLNQDLERQRRDVVMLQRQVAKSEKSQKLSFIIGAAALLLAITAAVVAILR